MTDSFEPLNDSVTIYSGPPLNKAEALAYIDDLFLKLTPYIYQNSDISPTSDIHARTREETAAIFDSGDIQKIKHFNKQLSFGRIQAKVLSGLAIDRLNKELAGDVDVANIIRESNLRGLAYAEVDRFAGLTEDRKVYFTHEGTPLLSKDEKIASIAHEGGHSLLGHHSIVSIDSMPNDVSQHEFDADHVGGLLNRSPKTAAESLIKSFKRINELNNAPDAPQRKFAAIELARRMALDAAYNNVRRNPDQPVPEPGQNPEIDKYCQQEADRQVREWVAQHDKQSSMIYPKDSQRLEELLALDVQLKAQDDLLKLSPEYEENKKDLWKNRIKQGAKSRPTHWQNEK
jgi:hypothetical protein